MRRTIKPRTWWLLLGTVLLTALVLIAAVSPTRLGSDAVSAELLAVTNSVAFVTITNRSSIPITLHVLGQSFNPADGEAAMVSSQYIHFREGETQVARVELSGSTNEQRVLIRCSPTPSRLRTAAFNFGVRHRMKWLYPKLRTEFEEVASLPIEPR